MRREENKTITKEAYDSIIENAYIFFIEYDKFRKENYHQIILYWYKGKKRLTQGSIAKKLHMDQSTISRKIKEIESYINIKKEEMK